MTQTISSVISIQHSTVLQHGYMLWSATWPESLNAPEPGQWVSWTAISQFQVQHGFVMEVERTHFSVLAKDTPAFLNESDTLKIQLLEMGGAGWPATPSTPRGLIVVENHALACVSFALRRWRQQHKLLDHVLVIVETSAPPISLQPSRLVVPQLPAGTIAAVPLFEDWQVASRIADPLGRPGCFEGHGAELAGYYLKQLDWAYRSTLTVWAAGSRHFMEGITQLATQHALTLHGSSLP